MKALSRCALLAVLVSVVVTALSVKGWATPPALKQRYDVRLTISPEPVIGGVCEVRLETEYLMNSPNTEVRLTLPDGIALLEGIRCKTISGKKGDQVVQRWKVKILEEGNYNPYVKIQSPWESGVQSLKIVNLYLQIREGKSLVNIAPPADFYGDLRKEELSIGVSKPAAFQSGYSLGGYVKYQDKDNDNNLVPLKGVPVRLYNSIGQYENGATTDANGYYSMSGSQTLATYGQFYVVVWAENEAARITNASVIFGSIKYLQYRWFYGHELNDGETVNFYNPHPERSRILETSQYARNWCSEKLNWTRSKIDMQYNSDSGTSYHYYDPISEYIEIYDDATWGNGGRNVQAHEYGHSVQYKVYGNDLPSGSGPSEHGLYTVSSGGFALKEGWAEFFASAVSLDKFGVSYYGEKFEEVPNNPHYPDELWWYPFWQGSNGTNTDGEIVEGAVASLLWDVFDSPSTPDGISGDDDPVSGRLTDMWEVFKDGKLGNTIGQSWHVNDIREFKYIWDDEDPPSPYVYIYQHAPGSPSIDAIYDYDLFGKIHVPGLFATIQGAINVAHSGDVVLVASGTYSEQVSMKDGVDLIGAGAGSTTINGGPSNVAVTFNNADARVSGFTLKGYVAVSIQNGSSAEVDGNNIQDSYVGIDVEGSNPTIRNNTITANGSGEFSGGGMYVASSSHPVMYNGYNDIEDNGGYGIYCTSGSEPQLGSGANEGKNNFTGNGWYNLRALSACGTIYAENNWWGTTVESEIRAELYHGLGLDYIDYDPWRTGSAKVIAAIDDPRERAAREENALGERLLAEGRVAEAIEQFKLVIAEYDDTETALFALDHLVQAHGYREMDLSYLESLAEHHPDTELGALACEFVVRHLVATGKHAEAVEHAQQILSAYPSRARNEYVAFQIGLIYLLMVEKEEADEAFRAFLAQYPVDVEQRPHDLLPGLASIRLGLDPWTVSARREAITTPESLSQNYPNPFNASTSISFSLPKTTSIRFEIYNILGQRVRTLVESGLSAGSHSLVWDSRDDSGREVSSGIYFYSLKAGDRIVTVRKMLLLR